MQLVWIRETSCLEWEFLDRINTTTASTTTTTPAPTTLETISALPTTSTIATATATMNDEEKDEEHGGATFFERIHLPNQPEQRIYVWTNNNNANTNKHLMFWMQSQSEDGEAELVATINTCLAARPYCPPDAMTTNTTTSTSEHQVDALSNILEHLGMPAQPTTDGNTTSNNTSGGGTLTLADLQGAMAGLGTTTTTTTSARDDDIVIPFNDIVTPSATTTTTIIQSLNESAKARLLELLPEEQRDIAYLEENLLSPQVQQTLRALSQAVSDRDGYHSLIANFQLNHHVDDGERALQSGNPVQAFLDCILASVKKEDEDNENDANDDNDGIDETKEEDMQG